VTDDGTESGDRDPDWGFGDWVARRAVVSPGKTAVVDAATGERWTYADLDRAVEEGARRLAEQGLGPGDHLGTLAGTRMETPVLVHAATRLGTVLVPLNARLPPERIADQIDRSDLVALVCTADTEAEARAAADRAETRLPIACMDDAGADRIRSIGPITPGAILEGDGETDGRGSTRAPRTAHVRDREDGRRFSPGDPRAILFTSGTTGDPKPVVLTAGNLLASAVASAFRVGVLPDDRWLCELPAYHMGGIAPFYRAALQGTTVVVLRRENDFDPERTVHALRERRATGVSLVPTQLERVLAATDGRLAGSLRFVLLGGGPAPENLVVRATERGVPVHPTYGMTETASQIATARPGEAAENPRTVGGPLAVTDVTVVDDDGNPLGPGEVGEFVVDGPTVTPGYYRDLAATDRAFGEYGLHTGDEGYADQSGRLYVRGRRSDRIVTGGENVSPTVVREAIRDLEGVEDAGVVGLEDQEWGERVAALVVRGRPDLSRADLLAGLEESLVGHERPKTVGFVEQLPRTASGTIDREAVRERFGKRDAG